MKAESLPFGSFQQFGGFKPPLCVGRRHLMLSRGFQIVHENKVRGVTTPYADCPVAETRPAYLDFGSRRQLGYQTKPGSLTILGGQNLDCRDALGKGVRPFQRRNRSGDFHT